MNFDVEPGKFVEENAATLGVIAILFIGVGAGLSMSGTGIPSLASISSQSCVLSSDQVDLVSNVPGVDGEYWQTLLAVPCGDTVMRGGARIDAETLKTRTNDQLKQAENGFVFSFQNYKGWAEKSIDTGSMQGLYKSETYKEINGERIDCGFLGLCNSEQVQK